MKHKARISSYLCSQLYQFACLCPTCSQDKGVRPKAFFMRLAGKDVHRTKHEIVLSLSLHPSAREKREVIAIRVLTVQRPV